MKPSVARRCKDQVRERMTEGERRNVFVCVRARAHVRVHAFFYVHVFCVYVVMEGSERDGTQ